MKYGLLDFLKRSTNTWVRDSRLAEIDPLWKQKLEEIKRSGEKIESRIVKDGNGEATMYRLVKLRGAAGDWRCASCYTNVSAEWAAQMEKTLADNIRQGYCTPCKKKRIFQPV